LSKADFFVVEIVHHICRSKKGIAKKVCRVWIEAKGANASPAIREGKLRERYRDRDARKAVVDAALQGLNPAIDSVIDIPVAVGVGHCIEVLVKNAKDGRVESSDCCSGVKYRWLLEVSCCVRGGASIVCDRKRSPFDAEGLVDAG
jgi:hypothetical protein